MDFFEAVQKRRSIRRFKTNESSPDGSQAVFPDAYVKKALEAAILAPNSSNVQTWNFHWIKSDPMKKKVVESCLGQSAARTASHLVVVTADPTLWRRSQQSLIDWVKAANAPKSVLFYYEKLIPLTYSWGFLNCRVPLKWGATTLASWVQAIRGLLSSKKIRQEVGGKATARAITSAMPRGPYSRRDLTEVAKRSAALACENFALAITAQGGATCMMEGFDSHRLRRDLKLPSTEATVMVIAVGYEAERGTWGPQSRLPFEAVVHEH